MKIGLIRLLAKTVIFQIPPRSLSPSRVGSWIKGLPVFIAPIISGFPTAIR